MILCATEYFFIWRSKFWDNEIFVLTPISSAISQRHFWGSLALLNKGCSFLATPALYMPISEVTHSHWVFLEGLREHFKKLKSYNGPPFARKKDPLKYLTQGSDRNGSKRQLLGWGLCCSWNWLKTEILNPQSSILNPQSQSPISIPNPQSSIPKIFWTDQVST